MLKKICLLGLFHIKRMEHKTSPLIYSWLNLIHNVCPLSKVFRYAIHSFIHPSISSFLFHWIIIIPIIIITIIIARDWSVDGRPMTSTSIVSIDWSIRPSVNANSRWHNDIPCASKSNHCQWKWMRKWYVEIVGSI